MNKKSRHVTGHHKESIAYKDDTIAGTICLICGKRVGTLQFRGEPVCPRCIEYIRANF